MAATPSAQPRLWRRSHRPVAMKVRGSTVLTAERPSTAPHLGAMPGLAGMPSNRRWRRRPAADAEKKSRSPSKAKPEQIEPRGQDRLGDAWRRWRRTAAKPTNPHGQTEVLDEAERMPHMAAAELTGARRNRATKSPAIRNR
jgi:hypothetical protein